MALDVRRVQALLCVFPGNASGVPLDVCITW